LLVRVAVVAVLAAGCSYPTLPPLSHDSGTDARVVDGRIIDGGLPDAPIEADGGHGLPDGFPGSGSGSSVASCPLPDSSTFAGSGQEAENLGAEPPFTEVLVWQGVLSTTGASIGLEAQSGDGSGTPDWPTGDVTPRNVALGATVADVELFIALDPSGSGVPQIGYLAVAGTADLTSTTTNFSGTITKATFQHYDNLFGGGTPTPDPDNCTTSVATFGFSAPIVAQATHPLTQHVVDRSAGRP
jgi:hypothetical protein